MFLHPVVLYFIACSHSLLFALDKCDIFMAALVVDVSVLQM